MQETLGLMQHCESSVECGVWALCALGVFSLLQAAAEAADRPGHEPRESCLMLRKSYVRLFDPPEFGRLCGQQDMITPSSSR